MCMTAIGVASAMRNNSKGRPDLLCFPYTPVKLVYDGIPRGDLQQRVIHLRVLGEGAFWENTLLGEAFIPLKTMTPGHRWVDWHQLGTECESLRIKSGRLPFAHKMSALKIGARQSSAKKAGLIAPDEEQKHMYTD
ncbi:hypothetical protein JZ751_017372 [Albula glossodonta]|uniref:Uncharacterized protein n=1 Tax=Albula glossodonta TaxID=121402 RepID=A0A8T2PL97_9TELE|nr:hypothetical protein JZ751_017372 [Albula glossodonta]